MNILMTVEELAKYLKIKPDTIYKKVRKGELPAIKLGKLLRFPKELIDQWIVEQVQNFNAVNKTARAAQKVVAADAHDLIADMKKASLAEKPEVLRRGLKGLWNDLSREVHAKSAARKRTAKGAKKAKKPSSSKKVAVSKKKTSVEPKTPEVIDAAQ